MLWKGNVHWREKRKVENKGRIGLFGGSFDPIHSGHLILAEAAADLAHLDTVFFIPTSNPPHKDSIVLSRFDDRKRMVELAISGNPRFRISEIEKKADVSYTADSVLHFREKGYGREQLHLLLGADSLKEIVGWKDPDEIFANATIIAMQRPGYAMVSPLPSGAAVIWMTGGSNTISSSNIRKLVAENRSIRYLVPVEVERYIEERSLYKE